MYVVIDPSGDFVSGAEFPADEVRATARAGYWEPGTIFESAGQLVLYNGRELRRSGATLDIARLLMDGPLTISEIRNRLALRRSTLYRALHRLQHWGVIHRKHGYYKLTHPPKQRENRPMTRSKEHERRLETPH